MNTASPQIQNLIRETCQHYDWASTDFPSYFQNGLNSVFPIVWFGELCSNEPKVITFGSNPSDKEFLSKGSTPCSPLRFPKIPTTVITVYNNPYIPNLTDDYNSYFHNNPYNKWFDPIQSLPKAYFGVGKDNCIHLDALPFATSVKFTNLKNILSTIPSLHYNCFDDVLYWGRDFSRRLMAEIVLNDNIMGISVVGKTCTKEFLSTFNHFINNYKTGIYNYGNSSSCIWKCELHISGRTIEVIGTNIYLPYPLGFRMSYLPHLVAAIKKL